MNSEAIVRLVAELDSYLHRINQLASPHPTRTFDGAIADLEYITSYSRAAIASIEEWRKP